MPDISQAVFRIVWASVLGWLVGCGDGRPRPNVLLVSIDSLRADHVEAYGYRRDTTPAIDRLAREGVRFASAIASSSWTLPTHVTLLTGLPPEEHGVISNTRALQSGALTLAEVLQGAGYRTAAFVGGPYLRALYGFGQGFDVYDESVVANGHQASLHGATSPPLTRLVTSFLDGWSSGGRAQPFFVFLHLWDVHYDYAPPPPYDTMFDPDYTGSVTASDFMRNRAINPHMARRDLEHVIALYDGEIRYTDDHLAQIVRHLGELGVLDDTLIVVTADHGEEFFEHGRRGHEPRLYDELLRVPLVMRFPPRVPPGQVVERQVRAIDIAPTVLGLVGVPWPAGFASTRSGAVDLTPWITGGAPAAPFPQLKAFSATAAYDGSGRDAQTALRVPDAKYIERPGAPERAEYYDLRRDPGEQANLLAPAPEGRKTPAGLDGMRDDTARWMAQYAGPSALSSEIQIDADQRLRLLQLGYIE